MGRPLTTPIRANPDRLRVTDLKPAQWRLMFTIDRLPKATISSAFRDAGASWDDLTDLEGRGIATWTGETPELTARGRSFFEVHLVRMAAVLTHVVGCRNGSEIRTVRKLAFEWTLLTDLFRAGWLEIRNSETGEHVHRPRWEEALQFGGWDLSIMRIFANPVARPYVSSEA